MPEANENEFAQAAALVHENKANVPNTPPIVKAPPPQRSTPPTTQKGTSMNVQDKPPGDMKGTFKLDAAFDSSLVENVPVKKGEIPPATKEEKKVEAPPAAEKVEDKPVEVAPAVVPLVVEPLIRPNKQRDYTGYTEQQVSLFKQMSNEAFEAHETLLKERNELDRKLKDSASNQYLQHPNAYILDAQYQQLNTDHYLATSEAKLWEQALIKAEAGEEFQVPNQVDMKTGQWTMSQNIKPTVELKVKIGQILSDCRSAASMKEQQMQQLQNGYVQRVKQSDEQVLGLRKKYFSWVADPKVGETKIKVNGAEKTINQTREDLLNAIPQHLKGQSGWQAAADMWVAYHIALAGQKEAKQEAAIAEVKQQETVRAEPTSKNGAGDGKDKGKKIFSIKGMPV